MTGGVVSRGLSDCGHSAAICALRALTFSSGLHSASPPDDLQVGPCDNRQHSSVAQWQDDRPPYMATVVCRAPVHATRLKYFILRSRRLVQLPQPIQCYVSVCQSLIHA